ncbi:hypothetical protein Micbo1qcDRAFT_164514 [Microdochium bolleyi]|uniref:DUF6594 domain-containing protein n=1 Tax=Microdochium bolleyi TaxID=196109 RepID=A0A136IYG4_9PEZI|nr:hypothetical protein Micbo1qcDRAFT_164514 [Microdochium bolleyi]
MPSANILTEDCKMPVASPTLPPATVEDGDGSVVPSADRVVLLGSQPLESPELLSVPPSAQTEVGGRPAMVSGSQNAEPHVGTSDIRSGPESHAPHRMSDDDFVHGSKCSSYPLNNQGPDHGRRNSDNRGHPRLGRPSTRRPPPLDVTDQNPQHVPPKTFQRTPGRPPYPSPKLAMKAIGSPLSQNSSTAPSAHHDDLFDAASTHSTTESFSPSYNQNPIYGRPSSSSGSVHMGPKGRVPNRHQAPNFAMAYQQSPVQSTMSFPGTFMHPNDQMRMNDFVPPPLTGYNLLATRLAARTPDGHEPPIQPLYRRFGALAHRLLLHLQDEISQLEENLHSLDDVGAHHRHVHPGMISPESRRNDESAWGETYQQRTHILGQIGHKLDLYNSLLKSFQTTQAMPSARIDDVRDYRTFLEEEAPIADIETHFLDSVDDLLRIPHCAPGSRDDEEDVAATPVQRFGTAPFRGASQLRHRARPLRSTAIIATSQAETNSSQGLVAALGAMSVSVLVPVLAFLVVPGFVGRMVVSLLVCAGVLAALLSSRYAQSPPAAEILIFVAFYGSVMAVLAGVVG